MVSQFVAGLLPALKMKVAGKFDEILVKACFEEAKLRELSTASVPKPDCTRPDSCFCKSFPAFCQAFEVYEMWQHEPYCQVLQVEG